MVSDVNDRAVVDRCLRSFIIKSIHAIVQGRNGLLCSTSCLSDVGSRNNMMLNIEEDPDVSASIKQSLDSGFQMKVGDVISLEIIQIKSFSVVEIWQFRLDTEDNLDKSTPFAENNNNQVEIIAKVNNDETKQSRLIERLGTLLKSIWIILRLLPAYRFCRKNDESFGFVIKRGSVTKDQLGKDYISKKIGCLNSGLEMKISNSLSPSTPQKESLAPIKSIFLDIHVYYQAEMKKTYSINNKIKKLSLKAAFVDQNEDENENFDEELDGIYGDRIYNTIDHEKGKQNLIYNESSSDSCESSTDPEDSNSNSLLRKTMKDQLEIEPKVVSTPPTTDNVPLSLPFSTAGGTTSNHLTQLFNQLKDKNDLEIFQVPKSVYGFSSTLCPNFLNEELERHERTLKEFDDFVSGLVNNYKDL